MSESDSGDEAHEADIFSKRKKSSLKKSSLKKSSGIEIVPKEDISQKHKKGVHFAESDDSDISDSDVDGESPVTAPGGDSAVAESSDEEDVLRLTTDLVGDDVSEKKERRAEHWFSQVTSVK